VPAPSQPSQCGAGSSGSAGGSSCSLCPAGKFTDFAGATSCCACAAGRFGPAAGATSCAACAAGTNSKAGAAACLPCTEVNVTVSDGQRLDSAFGWRLDSGAMDEQVDEQVCLAPGAHTFTALYDIGYERDWRGGGYWTVARGCEVLGGGPSAGLVPYISQPPHLFPKDFNFAVTISQCRAGSFGSVDGGDCSLCPPGTYNNFAGATSLHSCCACSNTTAAVGFGFANCSSPCTALDTSSLAALLRSVELYFMLALFGITTAVWKLALPRGTAGSTAVYCLFPLLAGLAVWVPAVARLRDVNGFVTTLCVTLALRTCTFTLKTKTLRWGGSNARYASYWRCLATAWLSLACFWAVVGSGSEWRAPFFWQPSTPFCGAFTNAMSPTRTAVCVLFSLAMAAHAWGWSWIARQSTPYQQLLPEVLDAQINERAVYSFNAKSAFLWIGGGQGLIGTANSYVSSVVPLLVYSEVLHVFKGTLLLYATFVEQSGLKEKAVGLKERWWRTARGRVVALAVVALILFSAKEVFATGARTADANSLLTIFVLVLLELGGDAELARRMRRSRAAGEPPSYLALAAAGTAGVPAAPQQQQQQQPPLRKTIAFLGVPRKFFVLAVCPLISFLIMCWIILQTTTSLGELGSAQNHASVLLALGIALVLTLVLLVGLLCARCGTGWRIFMPMHAAHTTQFVVGMVVPLIFAVYERKLDDSVGSVFAFAVVLAVFKVHVFSLKIHSLRRSTWDSPHADFLHRVWWRTCCTCWLGAAISAVVGWQGVRSKCAIAFCFLMALDALFWGRAAERCKALAAKTVFTKDFTPTQIALFNAKQVYVWVLQLSTLLAGDDVTRGDTNGVLQLTYLGAFLMVLHCFKSSIFTNSVFDASGSMAGPSGLSARALTRLSTGVGLALFAWVTFLSQGGTLMDDFAAKLSTVSAFALLAPELLADCHLLFMWNSGGAGLSGAGCALDANLLDNGDGAPDHAPGADGHTTGEEGVAEGGIVPYRTQRRAVTMYGAAVIVLAIISIARFSAVFELSRD
jgi:hypothetical protein